ncbi:hypothetical protein A3Q56_01797 [Intoshia linei]|uniref:uridine/cytidine kinase n=1 Tax=Intoshia linei TaxID=1819745 RepID=A0A177B9Y8_9BILA|nr:hypothetical protein A3Q56_01797 [Intoshia linei]
MKLSNSDIRQTDILLTPKVRDEIVKINSVILGISGGPASGKTVVSEKIISHLISYGIPKNDIAIIGMSSYYKELTPESKQAAINGNYNFDHPDSFDEDKMFTDLINLKHKKRIKIRLYDFVNFEFLGNEEKIIKPNKVIIFEGILSFYFEKIRNLFDVKLFIDSESDIRLSRIIYRDMNDRKREMADVIDHYTKFIKISFESFCLPTKKYADVIIPRGVDNEIAIEVVAKYISNIINTSECIK